MPKSAVPMKPIPLAHEGHLVSRNVRVGPRRTSVRLEPRVWDALAYICEQDKTTVNSICTLVGLAVPAGQGFTSAVRMYVLGWFIGRYSRIVAATG